MQRKLHWELVFIVLVWHVSVFAQEIAGIEPILSETQVIDESYRFEPVIKEMKFVNATQQPVSALDPNLAQVQIVLDMNVVDVNYLAGLSPLALDAYAFDLQGNVYSPVGYVPPSIREYPLLKYVKDISATARTCCGLYIEVPRPFNYTLSIDVDPNLGCPSVLSELTWTQNVLLARYYSQVDIPFVAQDYAYELAGGAHLRVDALNVSGKNFNYRMIVENTGDYLLVNRIPNTCRPSRGCKTPTFDLPDNLVQLPRFFDENSCEAKMTYLASGSSGFGNTIQFSGSGTCVTDFNIAMVRFRLARDLYEVPATFTLKDIPINIHTKQ